MILPCSKSLAKVEYVRWLLWPKKWLYLSLLYRNSSIEDHFDELRDVPYKKLLAKLGISLLRVGVPTAVILGSFTIFNDAVANNSSFGMVIGSIGFAGLGSAATNLAVLTDENKLRTFATYFRKRLLDHQTL